MLDRAAQARAIVDAEQRARIESRRRLSILRVEIASPCEAKWDEMVGDQKTRFCLSCEKNVHDLTAMSAREVSAFFDESANDRACVRVWQRTDGMILREDCPLGIRRQRLRGVLLSGVSIAAVALGCFTGLALLHARSAHTNQSTKMDTPIAHHKPVHEPGLLTVLSSEGAVLFIDEKPIGNVTSAFPVDANVVHVVRVTDPRNGYEATTTVTVRPGALETVSLVPRARELQHYAGGRVSRPRIDAELTAFGGTPPKTKGHR